MPSPSQLAAARHRKAGLMGSTVRIERESGSTRNTTTGKVEKTWTTVYEGPGRLRATDTQPRDVDAAGQRLVEQTPTVSLPIGEDLRIVTGSSGAVRPDDVGEVIANPDDVSAVGLRFRIAGEHDQTHSTSRRLPVEVLTHGGRLPG